MMQESLTQLRNRVLTQRHDELARAIELRDQGEHWKAMYHTGLADGRNGVAKDITMILEGRA